MIPIILTQNVKRMQKERIYGPAGLLINTYIGGDLQNVCSGSQFLDILLNGLEGLNRLCLLKIVKVPCFRQNEVTEHQGLRRIGEAARGLPCSGSPCLHNAFVQGKNAQDAIRFFKENTSNNDAANR